MDNLAEYISARIEEEEEAIELAKIEEDLARSNKNVGASIEAMKIVLGHIGALNAFREIEAIINALIE